VFPPGYGKSQSLDSDSEEESRSENKAGGESRDLNVPLDSDSEEDYTNVLCSPEYFFCSVFCCYFGVKTGENQNSVSGQT